MGGGKGEVLLVVLLSAAMVFCAMPLREPVWDAAVYWGAGKFLASAGQAGLWEPLRPPLLPACMAVAWLLGLSWRVVAWSLGILLLAALVLLARGLGKGAWLGLALLSPIVVFSAPRGLSELPAAVLALAALVCLSRDRPGVAGLLAALSFLCKFPMGLLAVAFGLALLFGKGARRWRALLLFSVAWAAPVVVYLAVNWAVYADPLLPFREGQRVIASAGIWLYRQPWTFYLVEAVRQNVLWAFAPVGAALALLRRERIGLAAAAAAVLLVGYFTVLGHKEARFLVLVVPFLAFLSWRAVSSVRSRAVLAALGMVVVAQFGLGVWHYAGADGAHQDGLDAAEKALPVGNVLLANPRPMVSSDARAGLLYYPFFDAASLRRGRAMLEEYDAVVLSDCDMRCAPGDAACEKEKPLFMDAVVRRFKDRADVRTGACRWSYFTV